MKKYLNITFNKENKKVAEIELRQDPANYNDNIFIEINLSSELKTALQKDFNIDLQGDITIIYNQIDTLKKIMELDENGTYKKELFAITLSSNYLQTKITKGKDYKEVLLVWQEKVKHENLLKELNTHESYLQDTDYKALKYSEGLYTQEQYEPIKQARIKARQRINEINNDLQEKDQ